jgi:hypothetical protein
LGLSGTQCQISVCQDSGRQRLIEATVAHTRRRCQVSPVSLGVWTSGYPQGQLAASSSGLMFTCKLAHRSPPCRIRSFAVNTSLIGLRDWIFLDAGWPGSLDLRQAYVLSGGFRPHISIATHSWQYTRAGLQPDLKRLTRGIGKSKTKGVQNVSRYALSPEKVDSFAMAGHQIFSKFWPSRRTCRTLQSAAMLAMFSCIQSIAGKTSCAMVFTTFFVRLDMK